MFALKNMTFPASVPMLAMLLAPVPIQAQGENPVFEVSQLAVSAKDLGDFPYLKVPAGFRASTPKTLQLAEKYLFPRGTVRTVEGTYWHADIFADGGEWNELLFLRSIEQQITLLGGIRVYDGGLPDAARVMIDENQPAFARDLYDPSPYRFRQFVIRAEKQLIWVEIGYGYNAEMIDLTVIEETLPE